MVIKNFNDLEKKYSPLELEAGVVVWRLTSRCKVCNKPEKWKFYKDDNDVRGYRERFISPGCDCSKRVDTAKQNSIFYERFKYATFDNFNSAFNASAFKKCLDYAESFESHRNSGRGLILSGTVGLGKTHLAAAIANYVLKEHNSSVIMQSTPELFHFIRKSDFYYDHLRGRS